MSSENYVYCSIVNVKVNGDFCVILCKKAIPLLPANKLKYRHGIAEGLLQFAEKA